MDSDWSFYEKIVDGWERTETENGVPYFVNHNTETTSWDHPYWTKILEGLEEYDSVKYAAYRTALKIRHLQKNLHLEGVELCHIQSQWEELGYMTGTWGSVMSADLLTLLINIFGHTPGRDRRLEEAEMLADLSLNLLLNLLDREKTGLMEIMSVKILLCVMSGASLKEKYRYFYQELHDPSTYVGTHALTALLETLMKIPDFLHESLAFGRNSEPAVASCSQMGTASGGITEDVLYRWLQKEPQTLVWIPILHRLLATQNVCHDVKCSVCKTSPIVGMRYKCLKCFKFNLCQDCFFVGRTKKSHKTKHPTQEYCTNSTAIDETAAFMKTLRNNLSRKQRRKACVKYLPIEADSQYTNLAWSPGKEERADDGIHENISNTARRLAELEREEESSDKSSSLSSAEHTPKHSPLPTATLAAAGDIHLSPISPKEDGLQQQRDELNAVILKLEEENRALYEQLNSMHDEGETDSPGSDTQAPLTRRPKPNIHSAQSAFMDTRNMPITSLREPLPCETTPVYLSVPVVRLNGYHLGGHSPKLPGKISPGHIPQPDFSTPDSSPTSCGPRFSSPYHEPPPYPTHLTSTDVTPPRCGWLGIGPGNHGITDSLNALDTSPARFSLPSPNKSCDEFNCEEAELRAIVQQTDSMFPKDLSFGRPLSGSSFEEDEMIRAANSIRQAMSEFVSQAVHPEPIPALDLLIPQT